MLFYVLEKGFGTSARLQLLVGQSLEPIIPDPHYGDRLEANILLLEIFASNQVSNMITK